MVAKNFLKRLLRDTQGATAVEYGLIAGLIVIGMLTALKGFASETSEMWDVVEIKVGTAGD
ncbi:MAG: Flp family type IVb pilin [Alteraurantiacibacter sp.]